MALAVQRYQRPALGDHVPQHDYRNGRKLIVWDCNGGLNQQFFFTSAEPDIRASGAGGQCVDVHTRDQGERVQLWSCNGTDAQVWYEYFA